MRATMTTAPSEEPVTLAEAKVHLKVEIDDDDALIDSLIATAREQVEDWTRRAIMTQTWDYFLDAFPSCNYITLPFGNLQPDVAGPVPPAYALSITYRDSAGTVTTMVAGTDYLVEPNGDQHGRIVLPYGMTWPSVALYPSNPIAIRFNCGWADAADVPAKIKAAIKILCSEMYENRGEAVIGQTVVENKTAEYLLASERLWGNF
jgi:uncharacterized phiE125 gp8 family phage protein